MKVQLIDPRDTSWEDWKPSYRVYFWAPTAPSAGWISEEWEITDADIDEILNWADSQANGRTFAVYVCTTSSEGKGLLRLLGHDPLNQQ